MRFLAFVILVALTAVAEARDIGAEQRAAASKLFEAQIAALQRGDAGAFASTFAADDVAVLVPDQQVATSTADIKSRVTAWLGAKPDLKLVGKPVFGVGSNAVWVTAELAHTREGVTEKLRLTELIVGLYEVRDAKAAALMVSRPVADAALVGHTPGKPTKADKGSLAERLTSPKRLRAELERCCEHLASLTVIGTSAGELAVGEAAVALIGKWQRLKLSLVGTPIEHELDDLMAYAMGQVSMARKGKPPVLLDVLVIGLHDVHQDGSRPWRVFSIHYAAARR